MSALKKLVGLGITAIFLISIVTASYIYEVMTKSGGQVTLPPPLTYTLNIGSSPVAGVSFTFDGESHVTPFSTTLSEGSHTVVMPLTITIAGTTYNFANWEDGSTNLTRTINLITDMTVTAYYEAVPLPPQPPSLDQTITANWETYTYGGEKDTALLIRWSHLPYHVAFWRNYVPLWIHNRDKVGFYFGWVEAAPYEPLCDDDRQYMTLTIVEQDSNHIEVEWVYDLTTFGGDVYHGDTQVTEYYTFYLNGLATREVKIRHGSDWEDGDRKKDGYEICEWAVLNPEAPSDNVIRNEKMLEALNPYGSEKVYVNWIKDGDYLVAESNWSNSLVDSWDGVIHIMYSHEPDADPFVVFGKNSMPEGYYPTYHLVRDVTFSDIHMSYHWPQKTDSYHMGTTNEAKARSLNLPTHTPIYSAQFIKDFEDIDRYVGPFKWLMGMGNFDELDLRELARTWLETGDVPSTIPTKVRIKILEATSISGVHIEVDDGNVGTTFNIYSDGLQIQGSEKYNMDTMDDYHTYRFTLKGNNVNIYVDGVLVGSSAPTEQVTSKVIEFGAYTPMDNVRAQWDYVRYYTEGVL